MVPRSDRQTECGICLRPRDEETVEKVQKLREEFIATGDRETGIKYRALLKTLSDKDLDRVMYRIGPAYENFL
jgi:hypothetical protein